MEYAKIYPEKPQTWKNMYMKLVFYMNKYYYHIDNHTILNASRYGYLEIVKYLTSLPRVNTYYINRAIQIASEKGHLEVVKFLSTFPDINIKSCIQYANENYEYEIVQFLYVLDWVKKNPQYNIKIEDI